MCKHLFIKVLLIIIFNFNYLIAQQEVIKLDYLLTVSYTPEILNYRNTTLIVSDKFSYYDVDYSPKSKGSLKESYDQILDGQVDKKEYFSEILIDRNQLILKENTFDRRGTKEFLSIQEELPKMSWKIESEINIISGYRCHKAKLKFRGRKYTAYFTNEIPVTIGPWKFNGLPGVIVSIYDETGIYKWELKKIKETQSINEKFKSFNGRSEKFKKVSYKEFDKNLIDAKLKKLRVAKSRTDSRGFTVRHSFSTEQWLEPSNEFRSKTNFSM
ncbi:hypothetical protein A9Q93_01845 [Nonlabens dokdonensis]|uniref:GLPGLI family protein n=1 Tax=Nonlabens dokdonensis TaxID=328515 RepID=A0A1Z8BBX8_9FLAO|nr:GLPGLI family protein [Nonlabens dokdonensis]OUS20082.1 hypothetical protein A9Q93_01845 [Nonlabens dokdonensis]